MRGSKLRYRSKSPSSNQHLHGAAFGPWSGTVPIGIVLGGCLKLVASLADYKLRIPILSLTGITQVGCGGGPLWRLRIGFSRALGLQISLAVGPADVCLFWVHIACQEIVACEFADASGRACCPIYTLVESQGRAPFVSVSLVWAWVLRAALVKSKNQCTCFLTKTKTNSQTFLWHPSLQIMPASKFGVGIQTDTLTLSKPVVLVLNLEGMRV